MTATTSAWNTGLTASVTLTDTGATTVDGRRLGLTPPAGRTVTDGWGAGCPPPTGAVTATDAPDHRTLAPGASVTIGYRATRTGDRAAPAALTRNGAACGTG
ncbi:hypothetical protein J2X68_001846 [Streptomyces sp. 3330]|uniref:cellulose binding domain-containing protein n=1 Tax=Streptomyces sp. 3330 TaxID=2817755 RepID=UPI0028586DD5|nr:cellulose binding domain-containing protein [Streptomyces sp. 3330]MDR6975162.1 hypothetical protein [Streptomyces sp. 3330]